jgi:hypothetical protein
MKKTFKKAIAVILTVLMVVCSLPFTAFTALAAPGDYNPDIQLQFGTFHAGFDSDYTSTTVGNVSDGDYDYVGLFNVPVEYDYTLDKANDKVSGTLRISAEKSKVAAESANTALEEEIFTPLEEDYEYQVGDYFTVTIKMDNLETFTLAQASIAYSDNIEPAGVYTYKSGMKTKTTVGTVSEATTNNGTFSIGGTTPVENQSARQLYAQDYKAFLDQGYNSKIDATNRIMLVNTSSGQNIDTAGGIKSDTVSDNALLANPNTGELLAGYKYQNSMVIDTYVFKITGDGPISFWMADPDDTTKCVFEGGYAVLDMADSIMPYCYTTYAKNYYINADDYYADTYPTQTYENPGSTHMSFMGWNLNWELDDTACEHPAASLTYESNGDGTHKITCTNCNEVVSESTTCTLSTVDNSAKDATCTTDGKEADKACDYCSYTVTGDTISATGHDYTGEVTKSTDGVNHTVACKEGDASTTVACTFKSEVTKEATYTEEGVTTYTCTVCGYSYTTPIDKLVCDHSGTTTVKDASEATCTVAGYTGDTYCDVCGEKIAEGTVIDATGHTLATTDNKNGTHTIACEKGDYSETFDCTYVKDNDKSYDATFDATGLEVSVCSECGNVKEVVLEKETCAHDGTTTVKDAKVATCTEEGYTGDTYCDICGKKIADGTAIEKIAHDYQEVANTAVASTCTVAGHENDLACSVCGETKDGATLPLDPDNHVNLVEDKAVAATCTATGLTAGQHCADCGTTTIAQEVTPMIAHDYQEVANTAVASTCTTQGHENDLACSVCGDTKAGATLPLDGDNHTGLVEDKAVAATCTATGLTAGEHCTACGVTTIAQEVTPKIDHTPVSANNAVAATVDNAGKEADTICDVCGEVLETGATIPALKGYTVTVDATDLGTVTLNGEDATNGIAKKVAEGDTVTLTAEPAEGATFVGWTVNGTNTISTNPTLTATVLANITYTPVFEVTTDSTFTVTFVDAFANVVSTQVVASGADVTVPTAPARPGYTSATDNGWSLSNDDIAALTSSATVTAQYTKDAETTYTVTATDCDITVGGETAQDTATATYDAKVTVTKEGATAWQVNGVTVAYGDSYSFFVVGDIELVAVTDAVEATPSVANVGVGETGSTGAVQAVFKATRTMADGYTYVNSGFVYGKGDLGEITLDDVNGSAVKAVYNKTTSEQFTLSYGLKAQSGTMTARAFLAYTDKSGETVVVYADPMTYTYR